MKNTTAVGDADGTIANGPNTQRLRPLRLYASLGAVTGVMCLGIGALLLLGQHAVLPALIGGETLPRLETTTPGKRHPETSLGLPTDMYDTS